MYYNCTYSNGINYNTTFPCRDYTLSYEIIWKMFIIISIMIICFCTIVCPTEECRRSNDRIIEVAMRDVIIERTLEVIHINIDYIKNIIIVKLPPIDQTICVICLDDLVNIENKDLGKLNNCTHIFHVECLNKWLNEKPICPVCRTDAI